MLVLVLSLGCAPEPEPGEPGSTGCEPFPAGSNCSVWQCWEVYESGAIGYYYAWGWDEENGTFGHKGTECFSLGNCAEKAQNAIHTACGDEA